MMDLHYEFPQITHLDQIKPAIENSDEFIIAERDWGYVVNYLVSKPDTFPIVDSEHTAIRRECRGIKFDKNGNLLARPYHKFFNIGEREHLSLNHVDLSKRHTIIEKLDGSMIHPIFIDDKHWRLCTKMGITEISMQAEEFVATHNNYAEYIRANRIANTTPIFEWCSRKNKIVIDYPEDRLVLTAIRLNNKGTYVSYQNMKYIARMYGLDIAKEYDSDGDIDALINYVKTLQGEEGVIVRFDDGHMVKIKADDYVRIHKAKDYITMEKNVIDIILNEKVDDVLPLLPEDDSNKVSAFIEQFWNGINNTIHQFDTAYQEIRKVHNDRKSFGLADKSNLDRCFVSYCFKRWDNQNWSKKDDYDYLIDFLKKNIGSQTRVDESRYLWQGAVYSYNSNGE